MASPPYRVFYSYSHADIKMLEKLRKHMAMLRRQGLIAEWYDRSIEAGSEWRQEIERELEAADVILLLVSADFLASEFCYEEEMSRAIERARGGEALVIGVLLRPVDNWASTPFAGFQVVPRDARPITKWPNHDEAYADVAQRVRTALEERARPAASPPVDGDLAVEDPSYPEPATPDEENLSATELALLAQISDPQERRKQRDEMVASKQSMLSLTLANLHEMREDMLRRVADAEANDPKDSAS